MRIVGDMNRKCADWLRTPEGQVAADDEETMDAAIAGYKAGYLEGRTSR